MPCHKSVPINTDRDISCLQLENSEFLCFPIFLEPVPNNNNNNNNMSSNNATAVDGDNATTITWDGGLVERDASRKSKLGIFLDKPMADVPFDARRVAPSRIFLPGPFMDASSWFRSGFQHP